MSSNLRIYDPTECGPDGYPRAWHRAVKFEIRELAGHRCQRCKHPYPLGITETCPKGEWTPCDEFCVHGMPARDLQNPFGSLGGNTTTGGLLREIPSRNIEAQWRILTVHHLNGVKNDLRWWNLVALCQRCHLQIQGKVKLEQIYPMEHAEWFKPYAAGWYAFAYLGRDLTIEETMAELDDLLALERRI